ncbi:MAG TPA: hypothetical protein DCR14_15210, partial [Acidimicrobiaceae bacterium]|nr:hypothetical protein [Acidimicrobiaceae bacterium]
MTDDPWRRGRAEPDDDFGPPLFGDDPQDGSGGLSFGEDTGPLPHWTEPPTGEIPRVHTPDGRTDPTDDLDVWSSFSGQQPVWRDGADDSGGLDDITGLSPVFEEPEFDEFDEPAPTIRDESAPVRREP